MDIIQSNKRGGTKQNYTATIPTFAIFFLHVKKHNAKCCSTVANLFDINIFTHTQRANSFGSLQRFCLAEHCIVIDSFLFFFSHF